jgi:HEAT repeat protein
VAAERSARFGGFALGAIVVCIGLILSLELGAWSFNLITGVLSAMTGTPVTHTADPPLDQDLVQLRESTSAALRIEAIRRLARSHEQRTINALKAALRDPDAEVSRAAATALGVLRQRRQ